MATSLRTASKKRFNRQSPKAGRNLRGRPTESASADPRPDPIFWQELAGKEAAMVRLLAVLVLILATLPPAKADGGCLERFMFSAAAPGYPAKEFWAPRLYRLHACHWPVSVSVKPPKRCDAVPGFILDGPYCPGSQPISSR
jgi:hypothetical protein